MFDNFCAIDCTTASANPLTNLACFTEGFITSTSDVDGLDNWTQCRAKKTTTCQALESAFDMFFDQSKIKSIQMFKDLVTPAKDTLTTCKEAYTVELATFGSWVMGTMEDPKSMGFILATTFMTPRDLDLGDQLGDLIQNIFYKHDYAAAGESFGLALHTVFGSPSSPVEPHL